MNQFPEITVTGNARQRGQQHGELLRDRIAAAIEFYAEIFALPEQNIFSHASCFEKLIAAFNSVYIEEIMGIAEGAAIDSRWVVALNARTEILSHKFQHITNECTALHFPQAAVLGQNWDWGKALEPLTVLMNIEKPDGANILTITEPGMLGKIGINSRGLGVCLNILTAETSLTGLPVHIVLRALLDCQSFEQGKEILHQYGAGKASNILFADAQGQRVDIEFCGGKVYYPKPHSGVFVHTNHYLGELLNSPSDPEFFNSYARYNRASELLSMCKSYGVQQLCEILSDDANADYPIYRDYRPEAMVREVGTVCSVVMDLPNRALFLRRGKYPDGDFTHYSL